MQKNNTRPEIPAQTPQRCPLCARTTPYYPRYPRYICGVCAAQDKRDTRGTLIELYNNDLSGGLKVVYLDESKNVLREDTTQTSIDCLIDGVLCVAEEARHGGVVIQKKDALP